MSIIKDLKNLFFGASSVGKSAAGKAGEFIKEEGDFLLDKTKDFASNAGETLLEKTSDLRETLSSGTEGLVDKTKDAISDWTQEVTGSDMAEKLSTGTEDIGEKVMGAGAVLMGKAEELSQSVGEVVKDKGSVLLDKSMDVSEEVGAKVLDVKDIVMEKAGEVKEQMGEKLEETMKKADDWAAEQKANPKPEFAEDTIDASGSLLEGTDDFFSKADKFADGQYGAFSEGKTTLETNVKELPPKSFESLPPATGFDDLDGDGNEIIDDAIIEE